MTRLDRSLLFFGALLASASPLAGCDDGTAPLTDSGPVAMADAGPPDAGPEEVMITGSMIGYPGGASVVGGTVCVAQHPEIDCVTTDADSAFTIATTLRGPVALEVTHEDFFPSLVHLEVGPGGGAFVGAAMLPAGLAEPLFAATGGPPDATKGHLASSAIMAEGGPAEGVVVTFDPDSGSGPVYFGADQLPDPELTSTVIGGFNAINLDPGVIDVSLEWPDGTCPRRPGVSWPGSDPTDAESTRVLIQPGFISIFGTSLCVPSEI